LKKSEKGEGAESMGTLIALGRQMGGEEKAVIKHAAAPMT